MANYVVLTLASPGESYSQLTSPKPENEYVITLDSAERQVNFILTSTASEGVTRAGFALNFSAVNGNYNPVFRETSDKNNSYLGRVGWYGASEYNPTANLSFDFTCQYRPPVGLVSVDFPDTPCTDFGDIFMQEGSCGYFELIDSNSWDAWTCETLSVDLLTFKLLNGIAGYNGQTLALDSIIISRFFNTLSYDGATLNHVLLSVPQSALLQPIVYSGEIASGDIIKTTLINPNLNSGEEILLDFDIHPSFSLGVISSGTGETLLPIVFYKWTMLPHNQVGGEYSIADLEINLPDLLTTYNYGGEYVTFSMLVTPHFWHSQYGGETMSAVFTNYPPVNLGSVNGRSGSTLEKISLHTYRLFAHVQYGGEVVSFDLTYIKNEGSPSDNYSGETLSATFSTQDALPFIGYSGEYAFVNVSTGYAFDFTMYFGSYGSANLQLRAPITLTGNGYSGEYATSPYINFATRFSAGANDGVVLSSTLATYPAAEMLFQSYAGEHGNVVTIQVPQPIGIFSGYAAEVVIVPSISSIENFRFLTGESVPVSLSTEIIMGFKSYTGDDTTANLAIKPSEGIGRLQPTTGEAMIIDALKVIQHHDLYVVFWHDTRIQIDMDSQTYFDLTVDSCCGGPRALTAQNFRIEMDFAEYPDQVHFGDRTVFQVDLSCRPRFNIRAHSGELFDIIDKTVYVAQDLASEPQMYFRSAEAFALVSFESVFVHRLCKGYFIPSGNNISIELTDVLDENCYVDRAYTGEVMRTVLHNTCGIGILNYFVGERLFFDLIDDKPWLLRAWAGENLQFVFSTTIRQDGVAREGSNMFVKFWEPDWLARDGQSVVMSLELEVHVEFIDDGCLDNEYIYMDENGDPIPEKFESVPIELYPYQHDIKTRCY